MLSEENHSLSVIIASHNGLKELLLCLSSLQSQQIPANSFQSIEIIVVGNLSDKELIRLKELYPTVRVLPADPQASVPHLRSQGIKEAQGDILALLEDHCIPASDWYRSIFSAHRSGHLVVGGTVENGSPERIVDWAVYLFEYSAYMNPLPQGEVQQLPGNNISYNRRVLPLLKDPLEKDLWESFWHKRLLQEGIGLISNPDMVVYHHKSFGIQEFWHLVRLHGHNYAVSRTFDSSHKKWLWMVGVFFLPFIMWFRIGKRILSKRRHLKKFILASPFLLWFNIGWTLGEITGTITKRPKPETGWTKP